MFTLEDICGKNKATLIRNNDPNFHHLDLRGGRPSGSIDDEGMKILIEALKYNTTVSSIVLAENFISDVGFLILDV